tara:strand:+ start:895 stop:1206 length:312 start_codon:yes stop_codon:yes gene_type:complete
MMNSRYLITVHDYRSFKLTFIAYEGLATLGDDFAWVPATLTRLQRNEEPPHILAIFRRLASEGWETTHGMTQVNDEVHCLWTRTDGEEGQNIDDVAGLAIVTD